VWHGLFLSIIQVIIICLFVMVWSFKHLNVIVVGIHCCCFIVWCLSWHCVMSMLNKRIAYLLTYLQQQYYRSTFKMHESSPVAAALVFYSISLIVWEKLFKTETYKFRSMSQESLIGLPWFQSNVKCAYRWIYVGLRTWFIIYSNCRSCGFFSMATLKLLRFANTIVLKLSHLSCLIVFEW